jgi:nucleoside-diphosphate-sugar epimerase
MSTALIGYTGFVGSTLRKQTTFDEYYNSQNIGDIHGKGFSTVVCAAAPAVKWKANQEPEQDLANLRSLMNHLEHITAEEFILISTVDVYKKPIDVNEDTVINSEEIEPYGKHRYLLEQFVQNRFPNHIIIRLPGLFGEGLKKNAIYDLMHDNCLHLIHHKSVFQFYDMSRLWSDLQIIRGNGIRVINFSTEPVSVAEIAEHCFEKEFNNVIDKPPAIYDMRSLHAHYFNAVSPYMITKEEVFGGIREFVRLEKTR